jgi:hypothetical protein
MNPDIPFLQRVGEATEEGTGAREVAMIQSGKNTTQGVFSQSVDLATS